MFNIFKTKIAIYANGIQTNYLATMRKPSNGVKTLRVIMAFTINTKNLINYVEIQGF